MQSQVVILPLRREVFITETQIVARSHISDDIIELTQSHIMVHIGLVQNLH